MSTLIEKLENKSVDKSLIKTVIFTYNRHSYYLFKYILVYYTPICGDYIIKYIVSSQDSKIFEYILSAHNVSLCKCNELKNLHIFCKKTCICDDKTYLDIIYKKMINLIEDNPNNFMLPHINNSVKILLNNTDVIDNTLCAHISKLYNDPQNWMMIINTIRECKLFSIGYGDLIFKMKDDFFKNNDPRVLKLKTKENIALLKYAMNEYNDIQENFCEIIKNVFVGDINSANNVSIIKEQKFNHIVSLTKKNILKIRHIEYTQIMIDDNISTDFISSTINYYPKVIESMKKNHNILIHCYKGLSRSICFILLLLIKTGMRYEDAYNLIKSKKRIDPNPEFIRQIKQYIKLNNLN